MNVQSRREHERVGENVNLVYVANSFKKLTNKRKQIQFSSGWEDLGGDGGKTTNRI